MTITQKLQAATGGDRGLDAMIHHWLLQGVGTGYPSSAPAYTSSIDAALMLVPEGWAISFGEKRGLPPEIRMFAWLNDHNTPDGIAVRHTEGSAHTIALALCIAALSAKGLT